MEEKSGNFYRLYQLAYQDRFSFYRSIIFIISIFGLFFLATLYAFKLVSFGFNLRYFLIDCFLWLISLALFCFFGIGAKTRNLIFGIFLLPIAFLSSFFYLSFPIHSVNQLIIFYFLTAFLLAITIFLFRQESSMLVNLSFYRIFKKGSWFLALMIFGVFYLLLSWQKSLTLNNLGDYLIDHLPLPFNYSVDIFLLKYIKGDLYYTPFQKELSRNSQKITEEMKKIMEEFDIQKISLEEQNKVEKEFLTQLRKELSQFLNKPLEGKENMNQLIKDYLKESLKNVLDLPLFHSIYIAVLIILALSLIGLINNFLAILISLIIHIILLPLFIKLKVLKIEKKEVEKEILTV